MTSPLYRASGEQTQQVATPMLAESRANWCNIR
jgi:hypothetical protein